MTNNDTVLKRIDELRIAKGWTLYKLADMAGITQSTLTNAKARNTTPSIATIIAICDALEITLSQFFTLPEEQTTVLSRNEQELIQKYRSIESKEKTIVDNLISGLMDRNK